MESGERWSSGAVKVTAADDKPQMLNEHLEGVIARSGAADEFEPSIELQQLEEEAFTLRKAEVLIANPVRGHTKPGGLPDPPGS